ncbi:MAG: phage holin family protein [Acidobacteriota bacterium]
MIAKLVLFTLVALVTPRLLPGVRVRGWGAAIAIALVFAVLNLLIGWLLSAVLTFLSFPFVVLTLGLFMIVVTTAVNAVLLKLTDTLLDVFELPGWGAAFGMGFLFAVAGQVAEWLSG